MVFTQGQQILSTTALPLCWRCITTHAILSTCKTFRAPPFTLLIVQYNSIYYIHVIMHNIIMQWLVQGPRQKGICVGKKSVLWPCVSITLLQYCTLPHPLYSAPSTLTLPSLHLSFFPSSLPYLPSSHPPSLPSSLYKY